MFGIHDEDLVAGSIPFSAGSLEYELTAVKTPVGLGIIATEGELLEAAEVLLLRVYQAIGGGQTIDDRGSCLILGC